MSREAEVYAYRRGQTLPTYVPALLQGLLPAAFCGYLLSAMPREDGPFFFLLPGLLLVFFFSFP